MLIQRTSLRPAATALTAVLALAPAFAQVRVLAPTRALAPGETFPFKARQALGEHKGPARETAASADGWHWPAEAGEALLKQGILPC